MVKILVSGLLLCIAVCSGLLAARVQAQVLTLNVALTDSLSIEMVWIPPGRFDMGTTRIKELTFSGDLTFPNERPVHTVTLTRGFYMARYELTQPQWVGVTGTRPWAGQRFVTEAHNQPATYVTWVDAQAFLVRLNQRAPTGVFRLPTEAEWEYAARAGTTTLWFFGDDYIDLADQYMWFTRNARNQGIRHPLGVGRKLANPWGLFDMHGNVAEWVQDIADETYYERSPAVDPPGPATGDERRIRRGGSWVDNVLMTRSAYREMLKGKNSTTGIRLVWVGPDVPTQVAPTGWGAVKGQAGRSDRQ